jgi:hypothetical protein
MDVDGFLFQTLDCKKPGRIITRPNQTSLLSLPIPFHPPGIVKVEILLPSDPKWQTVPFLDLGA